MSSNETSICVERVSKCYEMYASPTDRIKQLLLPDVGRLIGKPAKQHYQEFWALRDVSFEVKRGQTVGILGRNGSGKSTLLQIIAGTLTPTSGKVDIQGRVAALLELGSGFSPEFSGRENVYLNGSLLGLSRAQIDNKFDAIASFANIGKHLDQPVKTYSSGMMLRLAFAVQTALDAEIIIIDEALAVGDARFQLKCFQRLQELKDNGAAILFVSHSVEAVRRLCDDGLVLDASRQVFFGDASEACTKYYEILFPQKHAQADTDVIEQATNVRETTEHTLSFNKADFPASWGQGGACFDAMHIKNIVHTNAIKQGQMLSLEVELNFESDFLTKLSLEQALEKTLHIGIRVDSSKGVTLFDLIHSLPEAHQIVVEGVAQKRLTFSIDCEMPVLASGEYFLTPGIALGNETHKVPLWSSDHAVSINILGEEPVPGLIKPSYRVRRQT